MIFNPFVLLLFLVAAEQALTYSTWRLPRTVSSSSFVHPTSRQQLVSSSFSRTVTPSLRSFMTFLSNSKPRSSSARHISKAKFDALEKEIGALKHLMKGGNSTTASADIRESVLIYEGSGKQYLRGMLKDLQREKSALQEENTALIISKAAVESKGMLNRSEHPRSNTRYTTFLTYIPIHSSLLPFIQTAVLDIPLHSLLILPLPQLCL